MLMVNKPTVFALAALTLLGCSNTNFSSESKNKVDPTPEPEIEPPASKDADDDTDQDESEKGQDTDVDQQGAASDDCASGNTEAFRQKLVFEATTGRTCPFGAVDNLPMRNGGAQARIEQEIELEIPEGKTLCNVSVSSPPQTVRYDDFFYLTLNDIGLIANIKMVASTFERQDGLWIYDWSKVRGGAWLGTPAATAPGANQPECLGQGEPDSVCEVPKTQTSGTFKIEFGPKGAKKLSKMLKEKKRHVFKLIVTGDNDILSDCQHDGITLDVEGSVSKR